MRNGETVVKLAGIAGDNLSWVGEEKEKKKVEKKDWKLREGGRKGKERKEEKKDQRRREKTTEAMGGDGEMGKLI